MDEDATVSSQTSSSYTNAPDITYLPYYIASSVLRIICLKIPQDVLHLCDIFFLLQLSAPPFKKRSLISYSVIFHKIIKIN